MKSSIVILIVFVNFCLINGDFNFSAHHYELYNISKEDYKMLPKIFRYNDIEECPNGKLFCRFDVIFRPINEKNPPKIWNAIQQILKDERFYRRDKSFHAMCIQSDVVQEITNVRKTYSGFLTQIENLYCSSSRKSLSELVSKRDILIFPILWCYLGLIIYCTIKTFRNKTDNVNSLIEFFSILKIWEGIRKPNRNADYNNLLFIQGMRTIFTILIITTHNYMMNMARFSVNPEYVEKIITHPYQQILVGSFLFLVQVFFVISSWLLALQLHNRFQKNGEFTIEDLLSMTANRYFRLLPNLALILFMYSSSVSHAILTRPLYYSVIERELNKYAKTWWRNYFFIQNIGVEAEEMYAVGTWYLAADTQMYFMSLILFYVSQKLKIEMQNFLGAASLIAVIYQIHTIMTSETSTVLRFSPRLLPLEDIFSKPEFTSSYIRTTSNIPSYMIGFFFGSLYFKNKHKIIFNTLVKKLFWYVFSIGVPLLMCLTHSQGHRFGVEFLISIGSRPLFSLGVAIGLLGMATKTGGFIKKLLEWRPLVFLGDFTYSTYLFHFAVLSIRVLGESKMIYFDDIIWVTNWIIDIILSFAVGIMMYVIVEYPCSRLQKIIATKIKDQWKAIKTKVN